MCSHQLHIKWWFILNFVDLTLLWIYGRWSFWFSEDFRELTLLHDFTRLDQTCQWSVKSFLSVKIEGKKRIRFMQHFKVWNVSFSNSTTIRLKLHMQTLLGYISKSSEAWGIHFQITPSKYFHKGWWNESTQNCL